MKGSSLPRAVRRQEVGAGAVLPPRVRRVLPERGEDGSEVPVVHETHIAPAPDDDVIENADADKVADLAEAAGDLQVFFAGGGITGYAELGISGVMHSSALCGVRLEPEWN